MARAEKLLERMRQTRFGWGQDDFRPLYRRYGFEVIEGARHIVVRHPRFPDLNTTVPRHENLDPTYARTAVSLIDELFRRLAGAGQGGQR